MKQGVTYGWYPARAVIHPWATEQDIEGMFAFLDEMDLRLGARCKCNVNEGLVIRLEEGRASASEARTPTPVLLLAQ